MLDDVVADEAMRRRPYMLYPLLSGRIVLDAAGIAEWYRSRIREYFAAHPGIERAWEEQFDLRRARGSLTEDPAFLQWSDFIRCIEEAFIEEIGTQQRVSSAGM